MTDESVYLAMEITTYVVGEVGSAPRASALNPQHAVYVRYSLCVERQKPSALSPLST